MLDVDMLQFIVLITFSVIAQNVPSSSIRLKPLMISLFTQSVLGSLDQRKRCACAACCLKTTVHHTH